MILRFIRFIDRSNRDRCYDKTRLFRLKGKHRVFHVGELYWRQRRIKDEDEDYYYFTCAPAAIGAKPLMYGVRKKDEGELFYIEEFDIYDCSNRFTSYEFRQEWDKYKEEKYGAYIKR